MSECQCTTWACEDMQSLMFGNGHNPRCEHYKPNVGAVELLADLIKGIRFLGNEGDGIPDELWDAYCKAVFIVEGRLVEDKEAA